MTARSANRKPDSERVAGDQYFTPDAVAEALVALLPVSGEGWPYTRGTVCLEPHVGGGAFARALGRRHTYVVGLDIAEGSAFHDCSGAGYLGDFLTDTPWSPDEAPVWIVGNPPYRNAEAHIRRALAVTGRHVAFLLRLAILETAGRAALWRDHPPRKVWVLQERPSFTGGGTDSAAYAFVWWDQEYRGEPALGWVSWRNPATTDTTPGAEKVAQDDITPEDLERAGQARLFGAT